MHFPNFGEMLIFFGDVILSKKQESLLEVNAFV